MKDRKGNDIRVGDRVYVLPEPRTRTGGFGWVRRISDDGRARVDDGGVRMLPLVNDDSWTWSAWVTAAECEKVL